VNENGGLLLTLHDKAVDFAMWVKNEPFEGACNFGQAVRVNPVHVCLLFGLLK
jgi:hypothetical protein